MESITKCYKSIFKNLLQEEIKDEKLKKFAIEFMEYIPEYFWEIPASLSGKYHPHTDLGYGGLVRHSLMTVRTFIDLWESQDYLEIIIDYHESGRDIGIIACLYHDVCKCGYDNTDNRTSHEHPIYASRLILEKAKNLDEITQEKIELIAIAISSHMGKWITSKYSDVCLDLPYTYFDNLIHLSDYIASRKYCLFDEDFFNKYKN